MPPKCLGCGNTTDVCSCESEPQKPDTIPMPRELAERLLALAETTREELEECHMKYPRSFQSEFTEADRTVSEATELIRGQA